MTPSGASRHECRFVEEQEPSGRLIVGQCLVCGVSAMDAMSQLQEERMDTTNDVFVSLLAAALWWRDYATNLSEGRNVFPESPYPALYEFTPYPPPGVEPAKRDPRSDQRTFR